MPNVWAQEKALQASPEQAKAIDTWTANFAVQAATYVAPAPTATYLSPAAPATTTVIHTP